MTKPTSRRPKGGGNTTNVDSSLKSGSEHPARNELSSPDPLGTGAEESQKCPIVGRRFAVQTPATGSACRRGKTCFNNFIIGPRMVAVDRTGTPALDNQSDVEYKDVIIS